MINKEKILSQAKEHVADVRARIKSSLDETEKSLRISQEKFASLSYGDQLVESGIIDFNERRVDELRHLEGSPYFVRCEVIFDAEDGETSVYFAKFNFNAQSIYSWVTPASVMRFERPGEVSYKRPDGRIQKIQLLRKDQYMIVDGKIKFLSCETIDTPRELVYEEYFSARKSGFILPEIVAQMEKAQDQVIRAHHSGPFLLSGPAGSGKTTLALHRVAYLAQSPDLSDIYPSKSIIIFVQDNGTKEYFSHLLPELGINDVLITTFSQWALRILDIQGTFVDRYGENESEKDLYEFQKLRALKKITRSTSAKNAAFPLLEKAYAAFLTPRQKTLFQRQMEEGAYDRIDLTYLLKIFRVNFRQLSIIKDYRVEQDNGEIRDKREVSRLVYSLAVVDEFQNYLPDQLKLIKSCLNEKTQSIVYVGDMAQQVRLGTIRRWEDIGEKMEEERKVVLEKVYRNTKNILWFIQKLDYAIEIPQQLKEGAPVSEYILATKNQEIETVQKIIEKSGLGSVGILAKENEYLSEFKEAFTKNNRVHAMTMNAAQGVEFDVVIIVGVEKNMFSFAENIPRALIEEKRKVNRDLLYVALTRAINELHVLGKEKLEDIVLPCLDC